MVAVLPMHDAIPRVLPNDRKMLQRFGDGAVYTDRSGLRVIVSTSDFEDGREWMHISMSREARMPNYDDMKRAKAVFAEDCYAIQVFPPPSQHINIHQFCLHLWVPLTGSHPLPDFGALGTI